MARGYCDPHYRMAKAGKPLVSIRPMGLTLEERFWSKVNKDGPLPVEGTLAHERGLGACWLWTGTTTHGYGVMQVGTLAEPRMVPAHRLSWEIASGRGMPEGLEPDHLCRVPLCVNSDHSEPVTHRVNMLRGDTFAARQSRVTHCPQGHLYDATNTRWKKGGTKRDCRACDRDRQRLRRAS